MESIMNPGTGDIRSQLADLSNKTMQVVYSATLAEAANAVTIQTDNAGSAISLEQAQLRILVPAGCSAPTGTTATILAKVNDIATGYRNMLGANDNDSSTSIGGVRNAFGEVVTEFNVLRDTGLIIRSVFAYSDGTTRSAGTSALSALVSGVTSITKIYFSLTGSYTLPAGTMIELRGSKA